MDFGPTARLALLTLPLAVLTGCGGSASPATTTTTTPAVVKTPIVGLVSQNNENFNTNPALLPDNTQKEPTADPNIYTASVILVTWNQLQPTSGSSLSTTAIESGLSAIAAYNTAHPSHPMTGKLRVFAGQNAPAWVMSLDGPPVTVTVSGVTVTAPRYWTANYTAAWTALQNQLAAIYDKDPRIQEVAVSGCSSSTAEPFIHNFGTGITPVIQAAGYTDAQYMTCLSTMATQYAAWTVTPLDYTFNGFNALDTGNAIVNTAFPIQVMAAWRAGLGTARGIIANHGLQPTLTADAQAIYPEFTALGPPIEFQSYGPAVDWNSTIALGLTYHPTEIEIWPTTQGGGSAVISITQLQLWASEL